MSLFSTVYTETHTKRGGVGSGAQREGGLVAKQPGAGAKRRGAGGGGPKPSRLVTEQTRLQLGKKMHINTKTTFTRSQKRLTVTQSTHPLCPVSN